MRVRFSAVSSLLATAMSSRPPYRGVRNPYGRGFSGKVSDGSGINQFVCGDSHFQSVRDANRGRGGFDLHSQPYNQRPPQQYDSRLPPSDFRPPQSSSHTPPYFYQNQSFRPPASSYNQHFRQQFKTPPQHFQQNQQLRPQFQNQKPLDYRKWEYARICPHPDCDRFTVLSYNILADYLAIDHRSKLYFHIPRHMMDWEWRKRSILFELGLWSADILCFQEVDRFHDLEEELKVRGYCGTWKMRTGDPVDGCAIFWRFSRFKLLHEESIEFNKFGLRNNVAQICVLERINQNDKRVKSAVPASTEGPSKVVVGNIHVLYNPRRGEIKLGQVRALLDRAYAVSKLWDDAPVILCGDFNCTPKSPLYNYISEQELELSGLPRDKISGQASAEIRSPRPFTPNLRTQTVNAPTMINHWEGRQFNVPTDKSPHAPIMTVDRKVGQGETPSNMQKNSDLDSNNVNVPTGKDLSVSHYISSVLPNSSGLCNDGGHNDEKRSDNDEAGVCNDKEDSDFHVETSGLDGSQDRHSVHFTKVAMHQLPTVHPHHDDMYTSLISAEQEDLNRASNVSCSELHQSNLCDKNESAPSGRSKHTLSLSVTNEKNLLPTSHEIKIPIVSTCNDCILDENTEDIFNKVTESTENGTPGEDSTSFLSALHGDLHIPSGFSQISESNSSECKGLGDYVAISELDPGVNFNQVDGERTAYDPSVWTPMEIETATGCEDSTLMKSPLKLRSTYSEVEDSSGTRDSDGEPLVTSYNRCFLGTVDYIWRSEGLQTVRVLAPIPKHAMQQTNGFPTKKWGSDHIALVSELAFTKDICN